MKRLLVLCAMWCLTAVANAETVTTSVPITTLNFADAYGTSFVPVHSGKFDDPSLPGFTTWAYRVDAPTDWTNSDLEINLASGTINHISPTGFGSEETINGLGDSGVFAPTNALGDLSAGFNGSVGIIGYEESPTTLDSAWFTTNTDNIGTFDIAMITLSDDANGTMDFRTIFGGTILEGGYTTGTEPTHEIRDGQIVQIRDFDPVTLPRPRYQPSERPDPQTDPPAESTPPTPEQESIDVLPPEAIDPVVEVVDVPLTPYEQTPWKESAPTPEQESIDVLPPEAIDPVIEVVDVLLTPYEQTPWKESPLAIDPSVILLCNCEIDINEFIDFDDLVLFENRAYRGGIVVEDRSISFNTTQELAVVPEPSTAALLALGSAACLVFRRRETHIGQ